ncbi:MAG: PTS sugar transporter subunit IIB [Deltaproteobacteria bacterium]|nr:PTS sugar transporter subunit IIB [Deltaproteobacteria bacterium]
MAMILVARVDSRLIHGQIITSWVPKVAARGLLVVDKQAAQDPFEKKMLRLAADSLKVAVCKPEEVMMGLAVFKDEGIIVLFRNIESAWHTYDAGMRFERLILGNCHFSSGKSKITDSVYLSEHEKKIIGRFAAHGVEVLCQALPCDAPVKIPTGSEP